jgi:hypothetical protein
MENIKSSIGNKLFVKLKSTTLAEVMVAMALLGLLITLTFSVLTPILQPDVSMEKLKALEIIDTAIQQNYFYNLSFDKTITQNGIVVSIENQEYYAQNNYLKVDFIAEHQESKQYIDKWVRFIRINPLNHE